MNFRTELHPKPADYKLNLASKVVTVGSCFSDVIGRQLEKYKIETLTNPFGTIFNPLSACKLLQICAGADVELADAFVENNGRWYSYDFHSSFSAETEEALYEILDEAIVKTRRFLKKADVLMLTLGTANIFRQNITGETVANCHKLPAANFTRETLLPEEIITAIAETHSLLRELNPNLKLVLTVSPVRHIKDSLELNSVSKAVLRLATHFLDQNLPDINYFPAYELLIDDLRDYRFYQEDLLHPTPMAENYIWEKFTGAYFDDSFLTFMPEWDTVLRAKAHKPFHPESLQHQTFIQNMLEKLRRLENTVNVAEELAFFENQVVILPEQEAETEETEEDETTEAEETIPGYFSEETEEIATEVGEEEADLAETLEEAALPDQKKRRKKPRRKKKKGGPVTEEVSLSEVGTAAVSEVPLPVELPSEPAAELAEILVQPEHQIEHYGETLNEAPLIKKPLSKSAKRRESRRKKKALAALETANIPAMPEENATQVQEELQVVAATFEPENASVPEEKTGSPAPQTTAESASEKPALKGIKKKGGRKKKAAFPELFAPAVLPETASEPALQEAEQPAIVPEAAPENIPVAPAEAAKTVSEKPVKVKGKARQPKKIKLVANNEGTIPVSEHIAVPFLPASELDEAGSIAVPFLPVSELEPTTENQPDMPAMPEKKRGRPAKPKASASKPSPEVKVSEPVAAETKIAKPKRKPAVKAENSGAKPGRKKKATPES